MKILILYTFNKSFLSRFYEELAVSLVSFGYDVTVFSLKGQDNAFLRDNVHYVIKSKGNLLKCYHEIYYNIKQTKPDVIISNFSYVNPALLFGKLFRVKQNIAWIHTLTEQINPSKKQKFIKRHFLKLANLVIVNSEYLKQDLVAHFKVPPTKLKAIPFWATLDAFKKESLGQTSQNSHFKIGCPGRLVPDKNQDLIISALSKLDSNKNVTLYLAGEGPNKQYLKKRINMHKLEKQIVLLGGLSSDEMIGFYNDMDVIVLPSSHEAFGLVFIEAISQGVPVLVSSAFGALTFIDPNYVGLSDIVFDPKDSTSLKSKLENIINGKGRPNQYYIDLYNNHFSKDNIVHQFKDLLIL
ncbi:glycosyltransferase family 4 protein [Winogradskyella helgolandensis]|uniref:glycosyltransferase family 4 protein n=1 Tax=Winogradskyella helgolandensis TaxID=2697010 RepID=UPI0015C81C4A|nr:glycosyltransferase family 4 protein [Winogradskyella helgolandensis]